MINNRALLLKAVLALVAFTCMFLSFYNNTFGVVENERFKTFEFGSESLVIGRLIKAKTFGVLDEGGNLGRFIESQNVIKGRKKLQTTLYLRDSLTPEFITYRSSIGLQGIAFGSLEVLLNKTKLIPLNKRISVYHGINCATLALLLILLLLFIHKEFGFIASIFAFLGIISSDWLTVFADNLYWVIWTMLLPMITVGYFLNRKNKIFGIKELIVLAIAFFINFACGYEYITTVVISTFVPITYFAYRDRWKMFAYLKKILQIGILAIVTFSVTMMIHIIQLSFVKSVGNISNAFNFFMSNAKVRTIQSSIDSNSELKRASAESDYSEVILKYLEGAALRLDQLLSTEHIISISYLTVILLFFILGAVALIDKDYLKIIEAKRRKVIALFLAGLIALLSSMSWFVAGKNHSYVHTHLNFIVWYIPFVILAFTLLGYTISNFYNHYKKPVLILLCFTTAFIGINFIINLNREDSIITKTIEELDTEKITSFNTNGYEVYWHTDAIYYITRDKREVKIDDFRFFLHFYPVDTINIKTNSLGFVNADFNWKQHELNLNTHQFSKYKNLSIAKIVLPKIAIRKINTGQFSSKGRVWEKSYNLDDIQLQNIRAYNITDPRWENGISRTEPKLVTKNNSLYKKWLRPGVKLVFKQGDERTITKITSNALYLNITVDGSKLDVSSAGYPNIIKLKPIE